MSSEGKVALVTGGNRGLGAAMCVALCRQGRRVVCGYFPPEEEQARAWQAECKEQGHEVAIYPVDVRDAEDCAQMVEAVERELGAVEVLVNNAGITRDGLFRKMTPERWSDVINTNLGGCFNMSKAVFEKMCGRGWGRIVNISSLNGQKGQFGQVNYAASKAGIHGLTMSLAQEGARKGVTVNTISPGYCGTEMVMAVPEKVREQIIAQIPVGRLGKPEEIARTVAFLTDDDGGFVTGADMYVNGGQYMH